MPEFEMPVPDVSNIKKASREELAEMFLILRLFVAQLLVEVEQLRKQEGVPDVTDAKFEALYVDSENMARRQVLEENQMALFRTLGFLESQMKEIVSGRKV